MLGIDHRRQNDKQCPEWSIVCGVCRKQKPMEKLTQKTQREFEKEILAEKR